MLNAKVAIALGGMLWALCSCSEDKTGEAETIKESESEASASTHLIDSSTWQANTAPRTGPHEVWIRGCDARLIGQKYQVIPSVSCELDGEYDSLPKRSCDIAPYCEGPWDCTESAGGRCEGAETVTSCQYPDAGFEPCTTDADCDTLPNGYCDSPILPEWLCYPTGECEPPEPRCKYAPQPCESDSDCSAAPSGKCVRGIYRTTCVYDECRLDSDCNEGQRCECFDCVEATCSSDADCPSGEKCQLAMMCGRPFRYDCTTPNDECTPTECDCFFEGDRWQCSRTLRQTCR